MERLQKSMRLDGLHPGLFFIALIIWAVLFISLTLGLLWTIWSVIRQPVPTGQTATWNFRFDLAKLTAMTAVLGAVVALPFTVIRLRLLNEQSETAKDALFNDKINAASRDLGARRTVTRRLREVSYSLDETDYIVQEIRGEPISLPVDDQEITYGPWTFIGEEEDDLVTRAAAIDRLEGLAKERRDEAPRIARMLSIYVRELSREFPARNHPRIEWKKLTDPFFGRPSMGEDEAFQHLKLRPDDVSLTSLESWAHDLNPTRPDMEKAAQTLGRLKTIPGVSAHEIEIDLREANLQGFDLRGLMFSEARLIGARMEGADLGWARMEGANLGGAQMEGANLGGAQFSEETKFQPATLRGAGWYFVDLTTIPHAAEYFHETFGDGTVILPDGVENPPAHWDKEKLEWDDFNTKWRDFQQSIGYTPPDQS